MHPSCTLMYISCIQVLFKPKGNQTSTLYTTNKRSIDIPVPDNQEFEVEIRAHTEGGVGAVSQIVFSGNGLAFFMSS